MQQTRYDLLLEERLTHCGCLKFKSRTSLHSRIFDHMYAEMKTGLREGKIPVKAPRIFEITISSTGIIVYTIHRHSGRLVKFIETTKTERENLEESMELLEKRMANYGLKFIKPQKCDYNRRFADIHISVEIEG